MNFSKWQNIRRKAWRLCCDPIFCRSITADLFFPEVKDICEHIESQPYPAENSPYLLPEPPVLTEGGGSAESGGNMADRDPLYEEIRNYVITSGTASTSNLQRKYAIGYNRAGKIMDQLEADGIVGPSMGGKPRAVLVNP